MAKGEQTNEMTTFMGRGAGVNEYGQIENMSWIPKVYTKTADHTCLASESGAFFVTTGATGAVNFTLPAIADGPFVFFFINGADQNITVTAETADTLVAFNDLAADSAAFSTVSEKIGNGFMVVGDGTSVFAIPLFGSEASTVTIAT